MFVGTHVSAILVSVNPDRQKSINLLQLRQLLIFKLHNTLQSPASTKKSLKYDYFN